MLRRNQQQRAKEFAEAQELSSRLMAIMGSKQPQVASDNLQSGKAIHTLETQGGCPNTVAAVTQSFGSSTSSTSGPTPKRNKTYQHFKSPDCHRAKISLNAANGRATRDCLVKERRRPLTDLSDITQNAVNSTPSQPLRQQRDQIQGNDEASQENRGIDCSDNQDNESVDDNHMSTASYQHSLNGRWDKAASEALEDTTVEF